MTTLVEPATLKPSLIARQVRYTGSLIRQAQAMLTIARSFNKKMITAFGAMTVYRNHRPFNADNDLYLRQVKPQTVFYLLLLVWLS
jgi:hypothetical protein